MKHQKSKIFVRQKLRFCAKGQLTIFIIIAIIALIAIGAVIYFMQKPIAPEHIRRLIVDVPAMTKPIAAYMYACIDGSAPAGIIAVARGGGYIFPPESIETEYGAISYGYRKGRNTLATIEEMQNQLSSYMGAAVLNCFDISLFEKQGFTIELTEITTQTQIIPNKVIFTLNIPMKITKGKSTIELADFFFESKLPLGRLYNLAQQTVKNLQENPEGLDITFTQGIKDEVELLPVDLENFVVSIRDPETIIENEPLTFLFATEHTLNEAPKFTNLPNILEFAENQLASFKVKAEDPEADTLSFAADPTLFDINTETGEFSFTPEIPDTYQIEFRVSDDHDNTFKKIVKIIIYPEE